MTFADRSIFIITFLSALGSGLIAGVFFAFSNFVMKALARVPSAEGMAAMQSINIVVLNPLFLAAFTGTAVLCVVLTILSTMRWNGAGFAFLLAGAVLYFAGTFLVTVLFNVPLNNALEAAQAGTAEGEAIWQNYLRNWTYWNHVRTIASLLSSASFILGLASINK